MAAEAAFTRTRHAVPVEVPEHGGAEEHAAAAVALEVNRFMLSVLLAAGQGENSHYTKTTSQYASHFPRHSVCCRTVACRIVIQYIGPFVCAINVLLQVRIYYGFSRFSCA